MIEHHKASHDNLSDGSFFQVLETALKKSVVNYRHTYPANTFNIVEAHSTIVREHIRTLLVESVLELKCLKFSHLTNCEMTMVDPTTGAVILESVVCLRSPACSVSDGSIDQLPEHIGLGIQIQQNRLEDYMDNGSGWSLGRVLSTDLEVSKSQPLLVGSGALDLSSIPNPRS